MNRQKFFLFAALGVLAISGFLYIRYLWTSSKSATSEKALKNARTIAASLNDEILKQLKAVPEDIGASAYESIKRRLIDIRAIHLQEVRFIYLYARKAGKLFFIADSEPADSKDCSPPGQEYTEASLEYTKPFLTKKELITVPVTDRWGTWVSVLVPMKNGETGEVTVVLGVDYPGNMWNNEAVTKTFHACIIVVVVFLLFIAFYTIITKNIALKLRIIERKRAEDALRESERRLSELNATKDKLFSIIAHDLKNPFNSILGFSDLLLENMHQYDSEKSLEFIEDINTTADHTLKLLENLLTWAESQTGQMSLHPENLNLQNVIREIVDILEASAKIKNISIHLLQAEKIEVSADKNMLLTILRNLIANAIKFTKPGGRIDVNAEAENGFIKITIADNGVGMTDEALKKLFQIDTNMTSSGTADEKGTGLGLIICKEFVERHGWKIWAESVLGEGAKFIFTIPKNK
jgi:signal transduction histidine kinase